MRRNARTVALWLLVAVLLVAGLGSCSKEYQARPSEETRVGEVDLGEDGASQATAIPGATIVSAVTVAPQGTTAGGSAPTPTAVIATAAPEGGTTEPAATAEPGIVMYTVASGDTLGAIAEKYGTTVAAIVTANGFANSNEVIVAGQQIKVPTTTGSSGQTGNSGSTGTTSSTPGCRYNHTVQAGEWIYKIGRQYGVSADAIIRANRSKLPNPSVIPPGLVLCIP